MPCSPFLECFIVSPHVARQHRHCCVALMRFRNDHSSMKILSTFKFPLPLQRARCWYFVHAYLNHTVIRGSTCWTRKHGSHAISPSMVSPSTFLRSLKPSHRSCRQHNTAIILVSARSISIILCNCNSGLIFAQPIAGPVLSPRTAFPSSC